MVSFHILVISFALTILIMMKLNHVILNSCCLIGELMRVVFGPICTSLLVKQRPELIDLQGDDGSNNALSFLQNQLRLGLGQH